MRGISPTIQSELKNVNRKTAARNFRPRVALIGKIYHADAERLLREKADVVALSDPSPKEVAAALAYMHGAIVRYPHRIDEAVLASARELVVVASSGRGTDSIDVKACAARGVAVVNNPGLGTLPVSEHAVAMMLALARRLFESGLALRSGGAWQRRTELDLLDINGRTLGIIGLGCIGSEMARKCIAAFGMKVLAYDPYVPAAKADSLGVTMLGDLHQLLASSNVVSLHCELNAETHGMMGEAQLRCMARHAFLINTARGKVVEQAALVHALTEGWIAGAALDVYEDEPLASDSPLLALPNLVLTPHVAGLSRDALHQLAHSAVTQVLRALAGERPPHIVNPGAWEAAMARLAGAA